MKYLILCLPAMLMLSGCVSRKQYAKDLKTIDQAFGVTGDFIKVTGEAFERQDRYDARIAARIEALEAEMENARSRERRSNRYQTLKTGPTVYYEPNAGEEK